MSNQKKHPEIFAAKQKLEAELKPLMAEREKHIIEMDNVQKDIHKLKLVKENIACLVNTNISKIKELRESIADMARAMGSKTIGR